jgi:Tol biopolymer transport system component
MDESGENNHALTDPNPNALYPAHWSHDGKYIAYAGAYGSTADPSRPSHIWVMNADGSDKRQLTSGESYDYFPTYSSDGKYIAFTSNREGGKFQIWRINSDGSNPAQLTKVSYDSAIGAPIEQKVPAWSPDGKYIAYWHGVEMDYLSEAAKSGGRPSDRDWTIFHSWHIWLMNADGTNQHELTQGDDPAWSPDSTMVMHPTLPFYGSDPAPKGTGEPVGVGATNIDGSNRHSLLTTPQSGPSGYSWQPLYVDN